MWAIHKALIDQHSINALTVPKGAKFLTVQFQRVAHGSAYERDQLYLWYECDPSAGDSIRKVVVFGTGWPLSNTNNYSYIGTVQENGGALIWHVYEVVP